MIVNSIAVFIIIVVLITIFWILIPISYELSPLAGAANATMWNAVGNAPDTMVLLVIMVVAVVLVLLYVGCVSMGKASE